jgi:hypothetical protein
MPDVTFTKKDFNVYDGTDRIMPGNDDTIYIYKQNGRWACSSSLHVFALSKGDAWIYADHLFGKLERVLED